MTIAVIIDTELGKILVDVQQEAAPLTAAYFLRYVDGGHYHDGAFYRVVRPDNNHVYPRALVNIVQGGLGLEGEHRRYPPPRHESTQATGLANIAGSLALAGDDKGGSSEFFINVTDNPAMDFGGTRVPNGQGAAVFAQVRQGMEIVRTIHQMEANRPAGMMTGQVLTTAVRINGIFRV